jgi:hypothetical protein
MLYQYRPQTSLYFGHRFVHGMKDLGHFEGYMAGETSWDFQSIWFFILIPFRRWLCSIEKSFEEVRREAFPRRQHKLHLQHSEW